MLTMRIGDYIGRVRYLYILSCLNVILLAGIIWLPILWVRLVLMFLHGCIAVRIGLSYVICSELFPRDWNYVITSFQAIGDIFTGNVLPALYFAYIS